MLRFIIQVHLFGQIRGKDHIEEHIGSQNCTLILLVSITNYTHMDMQEWTCEGN